MKLFLMAFLMAASFTASAVQQPVFDAKTGLLTIPSLKVIGGRPSMAVVKFNFEKKTFEIQDFGSLFNCPNAAIGEVGFSPVNYNCGD